MMAIEVITKMELKPWQTPNFAVINAPAGRKEDGIQSLATLAVADLEYDALNALADAWLKDLYSKARRPCPFLRGNS